jgi:hypothetical protein
VAIREWMAGISTASLGPKIGAGRRAQVGKWGVEEARTRDSARAWGGELGGFWG